MDYNIQEITNLKNQLKDLPHSSYWQIPLAGAKYLYQTVFDLKPNLILEIGTSSGYSSLWMAEALIASQNTQAKIITVESHQARFEFADQNFKKLGLTPLIKNYRGHAPEIFTEINFEAPIDFAFFDGTKSQTIAFFKAIYPLLSPKGVIVVDNITSHLAKFQPFLDYLKDNSYTFKVLDIGDGLCQINKSA